MTALQIYLICLGSFFIFISILSFPIPKLLARKKWEYDFEGREQVMKRYLLHQRINMAMLGIIIIISVFLPKNLQISLSLFLMLLDFISVLCCNNINLGRWIAYKR